MPLLQMKNVNINYRLKNRQVRAVRDFTLDINEGDIVGVIANRDLERARSHTA